MRRSAYAFLSACATSAAVYTLIPSEVGKQALFDAFTPDAETDAADLGQGVLFGAPMADAEHGWTQLPTAS